MRVFIFVTLIISTLLSGCGVINARENNGMGHPYIATEESLDNFARVNIISIMFFPPAAFFTIPFTTADVGASLITDTILLPFDLIISPDRTNRDTIGDHKIF